MTSQDQPSAVADPRWWDTATKVLALAAVLLPGVGLAIRYLRFLFDAHVGWDVITAASTVNLVVSGFITVGPSLALGAFMVYLYGRLSVMEGLGQDSDRAYERSGVGKIDLHVLQIRADELRERGERLTLEQERTGSGSGCRISRRKAVNQESRGGVGDRLRHVASRQRADDGRCGCDWGPNRSRSRGPTSRDG